MLKISRAALVAAMLSVSALPLAAAPAYAQDTPAMTTSVSVPTITLVDSNMDEAALRDVFNGNVLAHMDQLAALNATSITIPEIKVTVSVTAGDKTTTDTTTYRDLVLTNVRNGLVETASIGGSESGGVGGQMTTSYGKTAINGLDIGAIAAIASSGKDASSEMRNIYTGYDYEGASLSGPSFKCSIGNMHGGAFAMRPLSVSFSDVGSALKAISEAARDTPPPDAVATYLKFVGDLLMAMKSEPFTIASIGCDGKSDEGGPFDVSLAKVGLGMFGDGVFPAISVDGLKFGDGGKNSVSVDNFTLKSIDLKAPIAALNEAGTLLTPDWLTANVRRLIPDIAGLSLTGLNADVDNPDMVGERIKASVGSFDLTLGSYVNGIPTQISTTASNVEVPLPSDPQDETSAMLKAMGIERVNLGYKIDANWNKADQTINVGTVEVSGVDLGRVAVSAQLANASDMLFDINPQMAIMAAGSLTVKTLTFEITDDGIGNVILPAAAKQQNMDPQAFRAQMGAAMEGMAIQLLGSTDQARGLGAALSEFLSGAKKTLTITIAAKAPAGVPLMQLVAQLGSTDDPMKLVPVISGMVDITGSAH